MVIAPDLHDGQIATDAADAERILSEMDPNATAAHIMSSVAAVRTAAADPAAPVAVVGYFSGASWALWLATRQPDSVRRVVAYYGTQNIDFEDLGAPVLAHFGRPDQLVTENQLTEMHAHLLLLEKEVTVHRYDAGTFFAERGPHPDFDPVQAESAWNRTVAFLEAD